MNNLMRLFLSSGKFILKHCLTAWTNEKIMLYVCILTYGQVLVCVCCGQ